MVDPSEFADPGNNLSTSLAAQVVQNTPTSLPPSFNGDNSMFLLNLFLMTGIALVSLMMVGRQFSRIWQQRLHDHPLDPVSVYRVITLLAATGLMVRCGSEAIYLWSWDPSRPDIVARALMAKRWLDPMAGMCGLVWMALAVVGEPGMEDQLRRKPIAVDLWSRWPTLMRAGLVIFFSFAASMAAVCLR